MVLSSLLSALGAMASFIVCPPIGFLCSPTVNPPCYPPRGCFSRTGKFNHFVVDPEVPEKIDTKFRLLTRETMRWTGGDGKYEDMKEEEPGDRGGAGFAVRNMEEIHWSDIHSIETSYFDPKRPTFIVTHGFRGSIDKPWLHTMCDAILKMDDYNCIIVGWGGGARGLNYFQAMSNSRVVAAEIGLLLEALSTLGAYPASVWLAGHSLGAHIMGFAGKRIGGVGRITGLDPASPGFEDEHIDARLDPTDALFIDVIHTDIDGFGAASPLGHVDFYPNGGRSHPGCEDIQYDEDESVFAAVKDRIICDHRLAHQLFTDAILAKAADDISALSPHASISSSSRTTPNSYLSSRAPSRTSPIFSRTSSTCSLRSRTCHSFEAYLSGDCLKCANRSCVFNLGPDAIKAQSRNFPQAVKTYLLTLDKAPYCAKLYFLLSIQFRSDFQKLKGQVFFRFTLDNGDLLEQEVTHGPNSTIVPGTTLKRLVVFDNDIMAPMKPRKPGKRPSLLPDDSLLSNLLLATSTLDSPTSFPPPELSVRRSSIRLKVRFKEAENREWYGSRALKMKAASVQKLKPYGPSEAFVDRQDFCAIWGDVASEWVALSDCTNRAADGATAVEAGGG